MRRRYSTVIVCRLSESCMPCGDLGQGPMTLGGYQITRWLSSRYCTVLYAGGGRAPTHSLNMGCFAPMSMWWSRVCGVVQQQHQQSSSDRPVPRWSSARQHPPFRTPHTRSRAARTVPRQPQRQCHHSGAMKSQTWADSDT